MPGLCYGHGPRLVSRSILRGTKATFVLCQGDLTEQIGSLVTTELRSSDA